jgi:hypothetical protein
MSQGIDDFTIVLPELTDMAACELKAYGLDRLWQMVERYKMTAPIAIKVVETGLTRREINTVPSCLLKFERETGIH